MIDNLKIVVYESGLTVERQATEQAVDHENLIFTTFYPGGLFGICSFFVPTSFVGMTNFRPRYRVAIWSGIKMIWEGEIDSHVYVSTGGKEGIQISCTGYWGTIMKRRRWDKIWCDTRLTEDKWVWADTGWDERFKLDRYNRLRITPLETPYDRYDYAALTYIMPTGQTINRVSMNYEFFEGTQQWAFNFHDLAGGTPINSGTASGTSTMSGTPAAGCGTVQIRFFSDSATSQTPSYDTGVYGEFTNIKVYSEAGTVTATEAIKDIRTRLTDVSSDESLIGTNNQVLEPLFMEGETFAEFFTRLSSFGDTSLNPWAIGLDASQKALAGDYKPVLYFEQQPVLTDYDYKLRVSEIEGGIQIENPYHEVRNWIILEYQDINGDRVIVTPDDDANLKDTQSISYYGQRDAQLNLGDAGITEATNYARRYLTWFKDPHPRMTSPATIKGTIRTKANNVIPVSWVRAGTRVLIENYLQEIGGSGIIFIVTSTRFDENTGKLTISCGSPDPLEALAARMRGL